MNPEAIQWPVMRVGGELKTLRYSHSATYQLIRWGFDVRDSLQIPTAALAAAMMGTFDQRGRWKSTGWERPVDLTDAMLPAEICVFDLRMPDNPILDAMVKAELWVIKAPTPAASPEPAKDMPAEETVRPN